jgi:hypothetical protein
MKTIDGLVTSLIYLIAIILLKPIRIAYGQKTHPRLGKSMSGIDLDEL